jgi:glyoxylase-like metal-dependent hydrolase (beta-lactamase superfamily II)
MVDIYLYDSSLFSNCLIVEDQDYTVIVDTGTSDTVNHILNYIHFNDIKTKNVLIIPSHYHFDHAGGLKPLIDALEKMRSNVTVVSTLKMKKKLTNTKEYEKAAQKGFKEATVGHMDPISDKYFQLINEDEIINLGTKWDVEFIETPGHSDDHISILFRNTSNFSICYFGEALGINLKKGFYPIPASSAPDFNSLKYIESINKLINYRPKINAGIFSHFGGICGYSNIQKTGYNAIEQYKRFRNSVLKLYNQNPATKFITNEIFRKYKNNLATQTLNTHTNSELSKSLAFTNTYGILLDEGLKKRL